MIKPAYSVSFLLSINIFVWQNVLYFLDAPRTLRWKPDVTNAANYVPLYLNIFSKPNRLHILIFHNVSLLMFMVVLDVCIFWQWAVLSTLPESLLPTSLELKWAATKQLNKMLTKTCDYC